MVIRAKGLAANPRDNEAKISFVKRLVYMCESIPRFYPALVEQLNAIRHDYFIAIPFEAHAEHVLLYRTYVLTRGTCLILYWA